MASTQKYLYLIIMLLLLTPACQKEQKERAEGPQKKVLSGETDTNKRIAELLASVEMHHFTDNVKAPDFELNSVQGERVNFAQYRGKVVLLSFWATW